METLDIRDIATDISRSAKYYMKDAIRDRLDGKLRELFDEALQRRNMSDVIEIAEPAAVFVDESHREDGIVTTIGNTNYTLTRIITPKHTVDVDEVRVNADKFLTAIKDEIDTYVQALERDAEVATVPALHVHVQAYMATWFLWGYVGRSDDGSHRQEED